MAMFSHPLGESTQFGSRLMMSLDPLTEQGRGYPLLFQTGESWNGQPLHGTSLQLVVTILFFR